MATEADPSFYFPSPSDSDMAALPPSRPRDLSSYITAHHHGSDYTTSDDEESTLLHPVYARWMPPKDFVYNPRYSRGDKARTARPPNAFMLFRSRMITTKAGTLAETQQNMSRIAAEVWNELPDWVRNAWQREAAKTKRLHALICPDSVYARIRKPRRRMKRKGLSTTHNLTELHGDSPQNIMASAGPRYSATDDVIPTNLRIDAPFFNLIAPSPLVCLDDRPHLFLPESLGYRSSAMEALAVDVSPLLLDSDTASSCLPTGGHAATSSCEAVNSLKIPPTVSDDSDLHPLFKALQTLGSFAEMSGYDALKPDVEALYTKIAATYYRKVAMSS